MYFLCTDRIKEEKKLDNRICCRWKEPTAEFVYLHWTLWRDQLLKGEIYLVLQDFSSNIRKSESSSKLLLSILSVSTTIKSFYLHIFSLRKSKRHSGAKRILFYLFLTNANKDCIQSASFLFFMTFHKKCEPKVQNLGRYLSVSNVTKYWSLSVSQKHLELNDWSGLKCYTPSLQSSEPHFFNVFILASPSSLRKL